MTSIFKNLITLLGLVVLAGVGYYLFVVERGSTIDSDRLSAGGLNVNVESELFLRRLGELQRIELSDTIFNDERFQSLHDFGTIIDQVPFGRSNPFAAAAATTTDE